MPLFHSKFTRKLASTIDLLQGIQTNPDYGSDRPIQYITGETTRMCRERKPSIASTFINSAFTMANPNVEKSKEFLRKLAKMHPPGEAKNLLKKESIVIVRNPENDRMLSFCDMDDFGSKALTRLQLDAIHEYGEEKYIHSNEPLLPPAPMLSYRNKNHRVLRAVASVGSIGSRTSSSEDTGGDSPPIGTPRDSFEAQHERAIMQATHSRTPSDGTTGSIKSVHIAKSVPLLNRSVHRRVVMNKSPAMPLDAVMMEVNQPEYTHQHYPHYIKRSHLENGDEGEVERRFGRPFSWDSDFRDQRAQSPSFDEYDRDYQSYRRKTRDSDTSEDWQVDYSMGNVQRLGSVTPQMVPAPRNNLQASASMVYLPSPSTEQSTPYEETSRRGQNDEDHERGQGLQPKRQTPLRPTRSQGSLRMRAKRAAPTPPEVPPVPAIPTAFKFPQIAAEESQIIETEDTIPVPRPRRISWGSAEAGAPPLSRFRNDQQTGQGQGRPERTKTLPHSTESAKVKAPHRPRRVSRDLPGLPVATFQTTRAHGSVGRARAAESANRPGKRYIGGRLHERQNTTPHQTFALTHEHPQQQKPHACALCQDTLPPNMPAISDFKCQRCAVCLCPECFEALSTVDEDEGEGSSESDYPDEVYQTSPNGHAIRAPLLSRSKSVPSSRRSRPRRDLSRRSLVERKKALQMAQCSHCLRCWCATCSKGDPSRFFQSVVTEIRDDSSEMTVPDGGIFIKQKKVCPGCYTE